MGEMACLTKDQIASLQKLDGNDACADCGERHPTWVSISHGTLICLTCSGKHRGLGVHISFVRSLELDTLSAAQHTALTASGGNGAWLAQLRAAGVPRDLPLEPLYNSNVAEDWRARVAALSAGHAPPAARRASQIRFVAPRGATAGGGADGGDGGAALSVEEAARQRMAAKFGVAGLSGQCAGHGSGGGGGGSARSSSSSSRRTSRPAVFRLWGARKSSVGGGKGRLRGFLSCFSDDGEAERAAPLDPRVARAG